MMTEGKARANSGGPVPPAGTAVTRLIGVAVAGLCIAGSVIAQPASAPGQAPPAAPPEGAPPSPAPGGKGGMQGKPSGPPPLPKNPDLPMYGPGGGRILFGVGPELETLRNLYPPLPANAPKPSANPRDLEGNWAHDQAMIARVEYDAYGNEVPFTPVGRAIRDRRVTSTYVNSKPYSNASGECRPPSQPWLFGLYYPFQIYQTPKEVLFFFAMDHAVWSIRMDGTRPDPSERAYMGESVGHWEGDTLVVDTTNYKDRFWIDVDGTPASRDTRMVYRIRKIDYGKPKLEIATTVYDPRNYTQPWTFVRTFAWRPDKNVLDEYNCESQSGEGASAFGLIPEPADK